MFSLPFELFLALRYLRSRRRGRLARLTALAAITGIACGVGALIIALALANGFRDELRAKILQGTAHISAARKDGLPLTDANDVKQQLSSVEGVTGVSLTTYDGALIAGADQTSYAVLRGLDKNSSRERDELRRIVVQGDLAPLFAEVRAEDTNHASEKDESSLRAVAIGADLAARLSLHAGDIARLISAGAALADPEHLPAPERVRVAAIFRSGLYEYDATWVYLSLESAKTLASDHPTGAVVNIETRNPDEAAQTAERVRAALGGQYTVIDWREANRPLFAALTLERRIILIIIALIVLIAALNITTSLGLIVTERRADIAILGALGSSPVSIMLIFLFEGAVIGSIGAGLGVMAGLSICFVGNHYHLISLPADVYSISHVPFHISAREIIMAALGAFLVSVLATLYPARSAVQVRPAEALRYE